MTYLSPDKQIPIMLDSNEQMYKAMQNDKVKMNDLEKVWLILFQQTDSYDAKHIVQCQRMLFESALSALQEFSRHDFDERMKEKELDRELSYEDAATYLDCSVSTIKRLVGQGKLNTKRYNNKVVKITVGELESFRASVRVEKVTPEVTGEIIKIKV
ncbi:MAG: hypothetical protein KF763_13135 [Cyclobacteriaceae bacterium]|nr:hypothetical protein [Cyclobacteriaceae bacterium]